MSVTHDETAKGSHVPASRKRALQEPDGALVSSQQPRRRLRTTTLALIAARRLAHTRIEVRGLDGEVVLQGQFPLAENILQVKQRIKVVSGRPTDQQDLLVSSQEEPLADDVTVRQARQVR